MMASIGVIIFAININILQNFNLGMGPFDTMTLIIMDITNITQFGNASFLLHFVFFIILLIFSKQLNVSLVENLVSLGSIFLISRVVNIFALDIFNIEFSELAFIINFLLFNFGLFLMAKSNCVIAPFDKAIVEFSQLSRIELGLLELVVIQVYW